MTRLTKNEGGVITYIGPGCRYDTGEIPAEVGVAGVRACLNRLSVYEDTDLEPHQIEQLRKEVISLTQESFERVKDLAKLEAEVQMMMAPQRWIEIEEEPCGDVGQLALLYSNSGRYELGEYAGEGWWNLGRGAVHGMYFTHWMPLPEPPAEEATP